MILEEEPKAINEQSENYPLHYKESTYLWHTVSEFRINEDLTERKQIQVIVDTDQNNILDNIEKVIYYLHPTFKNNIKEVTDRKHFFMLKFRAWGSFNLKAEIYFKGYQEPLVLYRYINLHTF